MLAFEISLLTGRHVATADDDRGAAEWPPHPARLFSALVAAYFEALDPPADERTALQWLETQGAPEITAAEASARDVVPVLVPVNDMRAEPHVVFAWPGAEPSAELRESLDTLAARVLRLGHSSSFVSVRVTEARPDATWVPESAGQAEVSGRAHEAAGRAHEAAGRAHEAAATTLRVVRSGQLAALCAAFVHPPEASGRVIPASFQRYVKPRGASKPTVSGSVFGNDWLVLGRASGPRLPSLRAVDVGRTLRNALMAAFGPGAPEILSGHRESGHAAERPHLAYVPLPFVAHERADGSILGAALVFPRDATADERRAVHRALGAWETQQRKADGDSVRLPVLLGKAGKLMLERLDEEALPSTLRAATWCDEATAWASATPVALDRNPGDLRAQDPKKEAAAYAEAEATIAVACERIGLPRPARVTVVPAAPLSGGDKARQFPPFATGKPPVQRVLVHATLVFETPVRGPILLGAGRYFGLGLFRPLKDHDHALAR